MDYNVQDPAILLSMVNMWLRDEYSNLDALCDDKGIDKNELERKLGAIDYHYNEIRNKFI